VSKPEEIPIVLLSSMKCVLYRYQVYALLEFVNKGGDADEVLNYMLQEKVPYKGNGIIIHGWVGPVNRLNGDIFEVFIKEGYRFLNVKDKTVIDIGAGIGDSAIYFALNGAKKVISLEPYPYSFNFAVRNVKENNLDEKVALLNAGYGKDGEIIVDDNLVSNAGTGLKGSERGRRIKIYSLKSLFGEFDLNDDAILKIDCEGCEYNLLNEEDSILANFSQIQIEYHYGYKGLVEKLRKGGFEVNYTEPTKMFGQSPSQTKMLIGYIYASKL
jgi:FkbM family methyltransferase